MYKEYCVEKSPLVRDVYVHIRFFDVLSIIMSYLIYICKYAQDRFMYGVVFNPGVL